jgi:hypothetical protein
MRRVTGSLRPTKSQHIGVAFAPADAAAEADLVEAIYPAAAEHGYQLVLSARTGGRALARRPRQHWLPVRRLIPPRPGASTAGHYSLLMDSSWIAAIYDRKARPAGPFRAQCTAEIPYPSVTNRGALAMPSGPPLSRAGPGLADRITQRGPRRSRLSVCRAARDSIYSCI